MNKSAKSVEPYVAPSLEVSQLLPWRPIAQSDPLENLQDGDEWGWD